MAVPSPAGTLAAFQNREKSLSDHPRHHGPAPGRFAVTQADDGGVTLQISGDWSMQATVPRSAEVTDSIAAAGSVRTVTFSAERLGRWDSALLTVLLAVRGFAEQRGIDVDPSGLPEGVRKLLHLAEAVPERSGARRTAAGRGNLLARVGIGVTRATSGLREALTFVGEGTLSVGRLLTGRARVRRSDLLVIVQQTGAQALPIVSLISVLVGLILAFVGAVQLEMFGAQIFVANLVGIAMTREMGAMMAAIIMAGRTGAAFAAELGTMQVNEEIDALKTLGIAPMDFLVLPRMIALVLMMPLLALYAAFMGIVGGALVGVGMLDILFSQYLNQTFAAVTLNDVAIGVVKAAVFGVLVAAAGCYRGMQCGRSAAEVGKAATSAVVTAIVLIVVMDGLFAVVTHILGV
ncbi:MAG: STAS domain-containing protein [Rhodospirillales bacterium]|nr:MAG: STAS domain-containing protein [Rhodospirillales bacterium]